jgi:hypothetical protein
MTNSAEPVRNIANILVQVKIMLTCHIVHLDLGSQIQQLNQAFHVLQLEHKSKVSFPKDNFLLTKSVEGPETFFAVLWNRNRNRKNRNFLTSGTGTVTGTVTC